MLSDDEAYTLAVQAQRAWLSQGVPLRLVWRSENLVFVTRLATGTKVALRLHRPGYQSPEAIATELAWCAGLADAGVAVAAPVPAATGAWVASVKGHYASCVHWIEGTALGAAEVPLENSAVLWRATDLGALLADLHNATDAGACPEPFARPAWDAEALLGAAPRWGKFWQNPALAPGEAALIAQARDLAREMLAQATDYGPIHADVLRGNVMVEGGALRLIDFDDSGPGWRLYDLASVLLQSWGDPLLPEQVSRLVAGYRSRRALPDDQLALLPLFLALRCFASAGWIVTRAANDPARQRAYALRAVEAAQALLAGCAPWNKSV